MLDVGCSPSPCLDKRRTQFRLLRVNNTIPMIIKTALTIASLAVLAVAPVLHAQNAAPTTQVANPSDALQGTWEGEEIGKESVGKYTMTIVGNSLRFDGPGKVEW